KSSVYPSSGLSLFLSLFDFTAGCAVAVIGVSGGASNAGQNSSSWNSGGNLKRVSAGGAGKSRELWISTMKNPLPIPSIEINALRGTFFGARRDEG
ncbi:hypothetical protein DFH27DRAFT_576524, partial [Peziza echinospora]